MRKLFAILLLVIHLFYFTGYGWLFNYLIDSANQSMISSLDENNYAENELIEITVPLPIPYLSEWKEFERIDGEIVLNGIHYNYVKQKLASDGLHLLCLPNLPKTQLNGGKNVFASQSADKRSDGKSSFPQLKKNILLIEYINQPMEFIFSGISNSKTAYTLCQISRYPGIELEINAPPPKLIA